MNLLEPQILSPREVEPDGAATGFEAAVELGGVLVEFGVAEKCGFEDALPGCVYARREDGLAVALKKGDVPTGLAAYEHEVHQHAVDGGIGGAPEADALMPDATQGLGEEGGAVAAYLAALALPGCEGTLAANACSLGRRGGEDFHKVQPC